MKAGNIASRLFAQYLLGPPRNGAIITAPWKGAFDKA